MSLINQMSRNADNITHWVFLGGGWWVRGVRWGQKKSKESWVLDRSFNKTIVSFICQYDKCAQFKTWNRTWCQEIEWCPWEFTEEMRDIITYLTSIVLMVMVVVVIDDNPAEISNPRWCWYININTWEYTMTTISSDVNYLGNFLREDCAYGEVILATSHHWAWYIPVTTGEV